MNPETNSILAEYIATAILKQPERKIQPDEKLITSGLIDSFHLVDLSLYIEEKFGVYINDTELNAETFDTLDKLAEIVESRRS
jgi:acyl carrier protein